MGISSSEACITEGVATQRYIKVSYAPPLHGKQTHFEMVNGVMATPTFPTRTGINS